jgi:hypothetical protein
MNPSWTISRIEGAPRRIFEHWQVLEVAPTGPCHVPLPGPRFLTFSGCTDLHEIIQFSPEIVMFDPTRMVGASDLGEVYGLGYSRGFTALMVNRAKRGFWPSTLRPRDITSTVVAMTGSQGVHVQRAPGEIWTTKHSEQH